MDEFEINLGQINGIVKVHVQRKNIKNVHLKVFRSLEVAITAPDQISDEWIAQFIAQHGQWIDKQITMYKRSSGFNTLSCIKNGSSTQLLGKDMRILLEASLANRVEKDEKNIYVYLDDVRNEDLAQSIFEKWWRELARSTFQLEMDHIYRKVFRKYGIVMPSISIKKMKTRWGSCTKERNKITFNEYLLKADIRCIQYVVLHELTRLLYPNHNADFYNFMTIHMPDWKDRKHQLDTEVVQGL